MKLILSAALLLVLPLEGLASTDSHNVHWSRHAGRRSTSSLQARNNTGGSPFKLEDLYRGDSFLKYVHHSYRFSVVLTRASSDWDFFSAEDPTHGLVNYQTRANAIKKKLAYVQDDGTTVLAVDDFSDVPVGGKRDS
jgi:hypothetical protein